MSGARGSRRSLRVNCNEEAIAEGVGSALVDCGTARWWGWVEEGGLEFADTEMLVSIVEMEGDVVGIGAKTWLYLNDTESNFQRIKNRKRQAPKTSQVYPLTLKIFTAQFKQAFTSKKLKIPRSVEG